MTIIQAVRILKAHNEWRRDDHEYDDPNKLEMANPKDLGCAIDTVVDHFLK